MKNLKYITLGLLVGLPMLSYGQSARLKYADKMYEAKSYYDASEAYEDVIERKVDSTTVAVRIADSYDKIGNSRKAVEWFRFLKRKDLLTQEQFLRLAFLEREVENYGESDELFSTYIANYGDSDIPYDLLQNKSIDEIKENKAGFRVTNQSINTDKSEMGVSYIGKDEVLIASSQRRVKAAQQINSWTGDYFYDLYKAPIAANGNIGKMKILKSDAKTKYHDGPAVYNEKTGSVYFTRSNIIEGQLITDKENVVLLKIFKAKLNGNEFTDARPVGIINGNNFSTAHPYVSDDGTKLFFASNRPGGFGGMDIYSIDLDENGNAVGEPFNLGDKINTSQNEVFPSYNQEENIVFFSSNGHYGLGGLDVYAGMLNTSGAGVKVENLGSPINTSADDFSYVSNAEQTKGYFASNREGGVGMDDIYSFGQEEPIKNIYNTEYLIVGKITDKASNESIANATIVLIDNKTNETFASITTDDEGNFETQIIPYSYSDEIDYTLKIEKNGFVADEYNFSNTLAENERVEANYKLVAIEIDKTDLNEVVQLEPIHFDLNSSYLREDAKAELDKIIKILNNNPEMHIDLRAHTDTRGEDGYNQWLSERRAQRSAEYIISSGIDEGRLTYKGFGESKLKISEEEINNASSEEEKERLHQINRRTEFIVVK